MKGTQSDRAASQVQAGDFIDYPTILRVLCVHYSLDSATRPLVQVQEPGGDRRWVRFADRYETVKRYDFGEDDWEDAVREARRQ